MNHHELYCHQNRWQPQCKERSKQFVDKITQRSLFRFLTFYSDCLVSRGPYKLYSCIQSIQSHFILIINIQAGGQRTISPNSVCLYCLAIFSKAKPIKFKTNVTKFGWCRCFLMEVFQNFVLVVGPAVTPLLHFTGRVPGYNTDNKQQC